MPGALDGPDWPEVDGEPEAGTEPEDPPLGAAETPVCPEVDAPPEVIKLTTVEDVDAPEAETTEPGTIDGPDRLEVKGLDDGVEVEGPRVVAETEESEAGAVEGLDDPENEGPELETAEGPDDPEVEGPDLETVEESVDPEAEGPGPRALETLDGPEPDIGAGALVSGVDDGLD